MVGSIPVGSTVGETSGEEREKKKKDLRARYLGFEDVKGGALDHTVRGRTREKRVRSMVIFCIWFFVVLWSVGLFCARVGRITDRQPKHPLIRYPGGCSSPLFPIFLLVLYQ